MYDNILVATDGSDPATAAATHAIGLADTCDATLHALYVIDTGTTWLTVSKSDVRDTLRDVGHTEATNVLATVDDEATAAGVDIVTDIADGTPDDAILAYITDHDIDVVVMGTHGRNSVRRRLLGSITERVVREAPVPVVTVSPTDD